MKACSVLAPKGVLGKGQSGDSGSVEMADGGRFRNNPYLAGSLLRKLH